jgi:hypothetical protein
LSFLSGFNLSPYQDLIVLGITVALITLTLRILAPTRHVA